MTWPLSQDYNEAIQNPATNFADPDLKRGEAATNALGLPMPYSGNFADVYQMRCPGGKSWAVKCFTRQAEGLRERYQEIAAHLRRANLPFTVDFTYLEQGIRVAGKWYPVLKMQWVEGLTLNQFISQNLEKPVMLEALLQLWARMGKYLRAAEIGHCDLQHGNVVLVPGATPNSLALKLIDYDGMWVPGLAGKRSGEVGHPCYQHPQRLREGTYSLEVDRFPLLLVATAMRALKADKGLWAKYDNGDNMLFKESDLAAPVQSEVFQELASLPDPGLVMLAAHVRAALKGNLESAPLLEEAMPDAKGAAAPAPKRPSKLTATAPAAEGPRSGTKVSPVVIAPVVAPPPDAEKTFAFDESAPDRPASVPSRGRLKTKLKRAKAGSGGVPMAVWIGGAAALVFLSATAVGLAAWALSGSPDTSRPKPMDSRVARNNNYPPTTPTKDNPPTPHTPPSPGEPVRPSDHGSDPSADADWLKTVAALPADQQAMAVADELKKRNPGFDGQVKPTVESGLVVGLEFITDQVTDLAPVRALVGLRTLKCGGSGGEGRLADLSPLKEMKLTSLVLYNTSVSDLSPLKDMKLTLLDCGYTKVSDLSPLKDMKLTTLWFVRTRVSDLSPLKDMKLMGLDCDDAPVSNLSLLKNMPLTWLLCRNVFSPWRDAEILRSITTLQAINDKPAADFWKEVDAQRAEFDTWCKQVAAMKPDAQVETVKAEVKKRNPDFDGQVKPTVENGVVTGLQFLTDEVTDISPVRALAQLRTLTCAGSNWDKGRLSDLSPLKDMKLRSLSCGWTKVSDLSPLKGMPLTELWCNGTKASDLSPLKDMKLTVLWCGATPLSDLSPLKDMKLTILDCGYTKVTDLSVLKGMPLTTLYCVGTQISDLSPLKGMPLTVLGCDFNPERDAEILRSIKTLQQINGKAAAEFWKGVNAKQPEKKP